jgi:uncharacterized peroxidase-related enzyme
VKAIWAEPLAKLGFVPNVLRIWALRPGHLLGWWAHYDELLRGDSGLTKAQREMVAVAVSTANDCHYCMTSHGATLRILSRRPELSDLVIAGDYASLEPREQAMLAYAVKVTLDHRSCTEADVDALRAQGWTDEDVFDITETAAMFNMTNRLANALGWEPNPEYDALGR